MTEVASSVGGGATADRIQIEKSPGSGTEPFAAQIVRRVVTASDDLDPIGLQAQLDLAAAVLGLARCVDEVVIPATRQLNGHLTPGRVTDQDAIATESVRTWLNHRGLFAPAPQQIKPMVLACGPRDRQLVALESLALLLRFQRWPCRMIGARVSTFALTVAVQATDAAGVVVMSTENRARLHAVDSLRAVEALGIPVFFAGDAFELERNRREVPGRYLGTGMERACSLLISALTPAAQRRSGAMESSKSEVE